MPEVPREPVRLPPWRWAFAVFKFADGTTHALFALVVLTHYGLPLWAVAAVSAVMNLSGVPAAFAWARAMEGGRGRRRAAVAGFAVSALALGGLAFLPAFPFFLALAVVFTAFGVATAPAASTLVLEGVPRRRWAAATGALSRTTGYAYLAGVSATVILGLTGVLVIPAVFAASAFISLGAAALAWRTIAPFDAVHGRPPPRPKDIIVAAQRRFERAVFFPARLFMRPTWAGVRQSLTRGPGPFLVAVLLLFFGTVVFLASYAGVLRDVVGLSPGLVLLAMAPASFLTPLTYGAAGRAGDRLGVARSTGIGALVRIATVPAMCIVALAAAGVPTLALVLLLMLHGLLGVSFAFLQVGGPLIAATLHPEGHADGVGAWHAAVGLGTMGGSVVATAMLFVAPLWTTYVLAAAATTVGCAMLLATTRRDRARIDAG